jgi:hypothetical protein
MKKIKIEIIIVIILSLLIWIYFNNTTTALNGKETSVVVGFVLLLVFSISFIIKKFRRKKDVEK